MIRFERDSRRVAGLLLAAALTSAGGACTPAAEVRAFDATPNMICAEQRVHLSWDVTGPASIAAKPAPAGWTDGPVASQDQRDVAVDQLTEFTLTALDAPPERSK